MQNRSLVVVLPTGLIVGSAQRTAQGFPTIIKWLPVQDEKTEYTIRRVFENDGDSWVLFEEGVIGTVIVGGVVEEIGLRIKFVREVQPPQEVQLFVNNILEEHVPFELV